MLQSVMYVADRPATTAESLELMGIGWGSIFVVILIMIVFVLILNRLFRK